MKGVMLDCSRNGVMTVKAVKKYAELLAKMGYNTLMLYTEDTYEVPGEPYFGYLRGKYTKEELKELDAYCNGLGIELVPCIQTLAHLNAIFRWDAYEEVCDCDDILLAGEERTYQLLERMFASLAECFTSRKIHIGMDEADKVGLGKYLAKHGYETRFHIINRHLHRVCDIAQEHGFEPMLWSDMFCRLALNLDSYYTGDSEDVEKIRAQAELPEQVSLVYWDYYSNDYEHYVSMMKRNQAFGRKVYFAGGAWAWKGFAPDNRLSMERTLPAMQAVRDCGVDGWFMTVWGDDGNECSKFAVLPALLYAMEVSKGNTDLENIKQKFQEMVGADFDTFLLMDELDMPCGDRTYNGSKCMFYNDPFSGIYDSLSQKEQDIFYEALAERLAQAEGKGEFGFLFELYEKLCLALAVKGSLGIRTREYYQKGNKDGLKQLALKEYELAMERIRSFHKVYQNCWLWEKKPQGFEIQDIRIGGVLQRLQSCKERLLDYTDGKLDSIPELEEELLPVEYGMSWARIVTANVVSHII